MKDELAVVLEAVRRAQAKVAFYLEPGNRDLERAFREIAEVLDNRELMNAMQSLYRPTQSPSVSPDLELEQEEAHASNSGRSGR
jgi:hypothetical protein